MRVGTGVTFAIAAVEAAFVGLWISTFARTAIGTPHQHWYVELPLVFFAAPVGASVATMLTERVLVGLRMGALCLAFLMLAGNLCALLAYVALSGGGV